MVTQQLLDYISQQLQNGANKGQLKNTLITNGWNEKDVDEALNQTNSLSGNNAGVYRSNFSKKLPRVLAICTIFILLIGGSIYAYNAFIKGNRLTMTPSRPEISQQPTSPAKTSGEPIQFTLPKPPYSLVISGEIKKDYSNVELKPFFFVISITKGLGKEKPSSEAQFKILLKKNGNTFYEDNMDATECIDWSPGDYCGKFDHSYGNFVAAFNEISELPDEIIIIHLDKEIYSLKEPRNQFPELVITSQEYTNGVLKVRWEATSGSTEKLDYLGYASNDSSITTLFEGMSQDGRSVWGNNSVTLATQDLIEGDIWIDIYATDGFRTYVGRTDKFSTIKNQVQAEIKMPEDGKVYGQNYVKLEANSSDPRTGRRCGGCEKEGNTFTWSSNIDGVLSDSHDTYCQFMTPGDHIITLKVKNENGTEATDSVRITVLAGAYKSDAEARRQKGETCY